jgi:RNA polymerase primary sigma factor
MIRLPLNRANELVQIEKSRRELTAQFGGDPTAEDIASVVNMNKEDVTILLNISRDLVSLESPVYSEKDSSELGDFIEDTDYMAPDEAAIRKTLAEDIDSVLATLTEKEAEIIRYRYGLGDRKPLSLKEIGEIYNLTKERIRQIEKKAITRLQHPSRSQYLEPYVA